MNVDTSQMDKSQPSNTNVDIESLPSTSCRTFIREIANFVKRYAEESCIKKENCIVWTVTCRKSNVIRKIQKQNWNQRKQIFRLKCVIQNLNNRNLISSDNFYTIIVNRSLDQMSN